MSAEEATEAERYIEGILIDNVREAVIATDGQGRLLKANDYACQLYDIDPVVACGRSIQDILPQCHPFHDYIASGRTDFLSVEVVYEADKTAGKWIESFISCLRDINSEIIGHACIDRDITLRRHSELALKTSEMKYRSLIQNLPYGIIEIDKQGIISLLNNSARTILANKAGAPEIGHEILDYIPDFAELLPIKCQECTEYTEKESLARKSGSAASFASCH
jgi:PAS domain S-box-containing protein